MGGVVWWRGVRVLMFSCECDRIDGLVRGEKDMMNVEDVVVGLCEWIGDGFCRGMDEDWLMECVMEDVEEGGWRELDVEKVREGFGKIGWDGWSVEEILFLNEVGEKVWGKKLVDKIEF